jgi:hypothetical protein
MAFEVGQVHESKDGQHRAIVTETRNEGREGLLRIDGAREEWALWDDGQWQLRDHVG